MQFLIGSEITDSALNGLPRAGDDAGRLADEEDLIADTVLVAAVVDRSIVSAKSELCCVAAPDHPPATVKAGVRRSRHSGIIEEHEEVLAQHASIFTCDPSFVGAEIVAPAVFGLVQVVGDERLVAPNINS